MGCGESKLENQSLQVKPADSELTSEHIIPVQNPPSSAESSDELPNQIGDHHFDAPIANCDLGVSTLWLECATLYQ